MTWKTFALVLTGTFLCIIPARADLTFSNIYVNGPGVTGCGGAVGTPCVEIDVDINTGGPFYTWTYTVKNLDYAPAGGNGLGGFELDLPAFPPDLGGVTSPSGWNNDCCSGAPEEWDRPDHAPNAAGDNNPADLGTALLIGDSAQFSFTTLPRSITNSTGWIHSWSTDPISSSVQININTYAAFGDLGPQVPNVLLPPIPEPASILLLGSVGLLLLKRLRARSARRA